MAATAGLVRSQCRSTHCSCAHSRGSAARAAELRLQRQGAAFARHLLAASIWQSRRLARRSHSAAAAGSRSSQNLAVEDSSEQSSTPSEPSHGAQSRGGSSNGLSPSPSPPPEDNEEHSAGALKWLAPLVAVGGIALMAGGGVVFQERIKSLLNVFVDKVDEWGPLGYLAYGAVYTVLELAIIPAIPLTMTAGVLFGALPGLAVVSASGTLAATLSFLIARYAARDKVLEIAKGNKKFAAIDRAIGKDSFKVVLLLRLSPLLPLALSNYLYGLTSVGLTPYVLGSWLGMLPGTLAYVSAGSYGRVLLNGDEAGGLGVEPWQVALGAAVTLLALGYVGQLAKKALDDVDEELDA